MRLRRALLYMPGDELHKIRKAAGLGVDCVCMDLEDAVALERKPLARQTVCQALDELDFGRSERLVRINPIESGLHLADLAAILPHRPDGIVIPKVQSADAIAWADREITLAENTLGLPAGQIGLIVIIESARAVVRLAEIAGASSRLQALIFGAEDLARDIGALRTPAGWEVFYARSAVALHAAAFGLQAIDMVYINFRDKAGLVEQARQGAELGFCGKQIIHPAQVAPVQEAFSPTAAAIAEARRIVAAAAEKQSAGLGTFQLDGVMIDAPIIKAAQDVLERARAAGKD